MLWSPNIPSCVKTPGVDTAAVGTASREGSGLSGVPVTTWLCCVTWEEPVNGSCDGRDPPR